MNTLATLKISSIIMKFFSVTNFIVQWHLSAAEDRVIDAPELVSLGLGICEILGVKTNIKLGEDGLPQL
jgi:hypothetical protein